MIGTATIAGGIRSGLAALTHSERQAAQNALSRIKNASGGLSSGAGAHAQNATLTGGSLKASSFTASGLAHGLGSDTFIGGSRTAYSGIGNDTVVSGSAKAFDRGVGLTGTHEGSSFSLSSDTIKVAGATALSVKSTQPEDQTKSHTVTLGDKTSVTISGLSTHDVSKISH